MKPIPTIEELIETARRDAKHCIPSVKEEQFADSISAPLFAAIQERDGEIERLRKLMSEAYDFAEVLWNDPFSIQHDEAKCVPAIMGRLNIVQRNGTTEPEPAKPQSETFEARGQTWRPFLDVKSLPENGCIDFLLHDAVYPGVSKSRCENSPMPFAFSEVIGWRVSDDSLPEPETWIDLGPEDVPMGAALSADNGATWWAVAFCGSEGVNISALHSGLWKSYEFLNAHNWQINRSLPLTGKWDAEAWEPCRKLKA